MDTKLYQHNELPLRARRLQLMGWLISGLMAVLGFVAISLGLR